MGLNNTAVLLIAFGRVEYARKTFDAIKEVKPKKFYFYSNKGRTDHPEECRKNDIVRAMAKEVDWDCEFKTWFRDEPVDMYTSLKGAIDWVFQNEEKAIILEEDCVASPAFFDFAEKMLNKYESDKRIWIISGDNYVEGYNPHNTDYHFSKNTIIYGWASWRNRWNQIDWSHSHNLEWIDNGVIDAAFNTDEQRNFHKKRLRRTHDFIERTKCWDTMFFYTILQEGGLCIMPAHNLVHNIGQTGGHSNAFLDYVQYKGVTYKNKEYDIVNEPKYVVPDVLIDNKLFQVFWKRNSLLYRRILNKVLCLIFK